MREAVVIGAGLSGLMGALALAEAGLRPLVLAKGQGATHWSAATIDIWGADHGGYVKRMQAAVATTQGIQQMCRCVCVGG